MLQQKIIILGKLPPPFIGTSIWFDVLRNSSLNGSFKMRWFNTNVHKDISTLGRNSLLKLWPNIKLYHEFRNLILDFKPDLVLIPISQSTIGFIKDSGFIWLVGSGPKILIMLHGSKLLSWLKSSSFIINRYFARMMKKTEGTIVLGQNLKFLFSEWFRENQIHVVPNGLKVSDDLFNKKFNDYTVIRFVGSLMRSKGIAEVVYATKLLNDKHCKFQLLINGAWRDKKLKREIEKVIENYSLPVRYEGEVTGPEKVRAYTNSDIFVFTPNRPEGHPMVIIEAMAAGLPIISTDQGAITESVIDGVNGFIVKPDSPEEIADKIRFLIDNPKERIQMGKESRRLYEEKFTEDKMVENLKRVFETVLNG